MYKTDTNSNKNFFFKCEVKFNTAISCSFVRVALNHDFPFFLPLQMRERLGLFKALLNFYLIEKRTKD